MTPCNPTQPRSFCPLCDRYRPALPHDAEDRPRTVALDGTVVATMGGCPMFAGKPVPVHWQDDVGPGWVPMVKRKGVWREDRLQG